jgi:GNAT superfamily N-acetyltransferase
MKIIEVTTRRHIKEFLLLPVRLYKNTPEWIRPLDKDIENVFDREKNKTFRHGECTRWILVDDAGKTIGRVAAFVNNKTVSKANDQPTGGMGFFECIEDKTAAFMLFDQCKTWLQERGMEAMDGPINFGNRDRWWGLLIEGSQFEPNYQCNYNFAYYKDLFEAYGFQVYFYQLTFARTVSGPISQRLYEKAAITAKNPDYEFRHLRKDEIPRLAGYIMTVYNQAWANRRDIPELTLAQSKLIVKQMKPIMDVHLLYFAFYKGEPVAFFLSLPEINQILKYVNGKLDIIGKLKFLWHTFRRTNRKAFGILFGVVPAHQGKGLDGAMVLNSKRILQEEYKRYDEYEMNWIGDFNPKMINVVEQVGADISKRHATYRKLFDESKPFKRAPILQ